MPAWKEAAASGNPATGTNWVGDTAPVGTNAVAFNLGSVSVNTNLAAYNGVEFGSFRVEKGYTGSHGDSNSPFEFDLAAGVTLEYNGRGQYAHYKGDIKKVRIAGTGNGQVDLSNTAASETFQEIVAGAGTVVIRTGSKFDLLIVKDADVEIESGVTVNGEIIFVGGRGRVRTYSNTKGVKGSRGQITYLGAAGDTAPSETTGLTISIQSNGATFNHPKNYATDRGGVFIADGSGDITFTNYTHVDVARQDFDPNDPPARLTISNTPTKIDFGPPTD